jgi:putrescine aminotransferase
VSAREVVRALLALPPDEVRRLYGEHVNPTLVEALALLGYGRDFVRAEGLSLWDAQGREYLDFLAGYGSLLLGHNHPEVREAVEEVLRSGAPAFLQIAPQPLAAALARKLSQLSPGGGLQIAYLTSSGSEAVEGAMKLARAATGRPRFVSAERAYHGLTMGALSITPGKKHRAPFGALLPGCATVPWGDASAVERELKKRDVAAVVLEPVQGEGGMRPPPPGYLPDVARLCKRYGTLLVLDEVQTGLGRTGRMFACEHEGVEPDAICLAKGLSGGLVPVSAYLTRRGLWQRAYGTLDRYDSHSATFSGGAVACAAALAALEVVERDRLAQHAAEVGTYLGQELRAACAGHPLVREVRGLGLMWGVELRAGPQAAAELAAQWVSVGLIERGVATQVGTEAMDTVRAEPALTVQRAHVDRFVSALRSTLQEDATGPLRTVAAAAARLVRGAVAKVAG